MPNWCENYIEISGDKESIQKIKEEVEKTNGVKDKWVFETLIGKEKGENVIGVEKSLDAFFGGSLSLYGTKWDVDYNDCCFDFQEEMITLTPNTAWSPPNNFLITLSEKYDVEVTNLFGEPGNDYSGRLIVNSGDVIENSEYTYYEGMWKLDSDDFWERIDFDLECSLEDDKSIEEILEEHSYITSDEDKQTMREVCEEIIERNKE